MHWRRVDPVQTVEALLLTGTDARQQLADGLNGKPAFMHGLPTALGENWAAIFARPLPGGDQPALPRLRGACPLYLARPNWWFAVGCELAMPQAVQDELLQHFAGESGLALPAILVPRFSDAQISRDVDIYQVYMREEALKE